MARRLSPVASSKSPGICLIEKKLGLRERSDSEYDSEANVSWRAQERETITLTNVGGSLGDGFFDNIESYSTYLLLICFCPFASDLFLPISFLMTWRAQEA